MRLVCSALSCGYSGKPVVSGVELAFASGDALCLLGPNGVGKTTLFRTMLGFLPAMGGAVTLDGRGIGDWPRRAFARAVAYVPQGHVPPFPFLVREVVLMGRNAHLGIFGAPGGRDRRIAEDALSRLGIAGLADRPYTDISGGERQLVLIARALAQEADLLVLDEPTSNLDLGNQVLVLQRLRDLVQAGIGVMMTTHAPQHAFLWAKRVALLGGSERMVIGDPSLVLTSERLQAVYGVEVAMAAATRHDTEVKTCIPLMPRQQTAD